MRLTAVLLGTVAICLAGVVLAVYDYTRQGATSHASRLTPAVQPSTAPPVLEPGLGPAPPPSPPAIVLPPELVAQPAAAAVNGTGPVALTPAGLPTVQTQPEAPPPPDGSNPTRGHGGGHDKDGGGHGGGGGGD
jgi:hypothetical protein